MVHGAGVLVFALPTEDGGAAFIQAASTAGDASQRFAGVTGRFAAQVAGVLFDGVEVLIHEGRYVREVRAPVRRKRLWGSVLP